KGFQPSTAAMQDLANFHQQQKIVSQQVQYPGCSNKELAAKLALRDLRALSLPLAKVNLTTNRIANSILPGHIVLWDWPDLGIQGMRLRIAKVGYGDLLNGEITLSAVQDVFSLPDTVYSQPQPSGWQSPIEPPLPIIHQRVIQVPKEILEQHIGFDNPNAVYLMTLAARPNKGSLQYQVETQLGNEPFETADENVLFTPIALLSTDINESALEIEIKGDIDVGLKTKDKIVLIDDEWISFTKYESDIISGIERGIYQSEVAEHTGGSLIYFATTGRYGVLTDEYQNGDKVALRYSSHGVTGLSESGVAMRLTVNDNKL
ncbi:MAG: hypothetical protein HOM11_07795, partial [Methylococcales bacterium]|nr:hypothetical protein [Methylococcales bacterium]